MLPNASATYSPAHARMAAIELVERGYLAPTDEANVWAVSPHLSSL